MRLHRFTIKQGICAVKNSANIIEKEHKAIFWEKGPLGYTSPKVLQRIVFFYVGLNFALRGVQEQYELAPAQFQCVPLDTKIYMYDESVYYQYTEFISKNNQHRFKDINARTKTAKAYAIPGGQSCFVKLLDSYLKFLLPSCPYLYTCMQGLESFPTDPSKSAYKNQRVGVNTQEYATSTVMQSWPWS